MVAPSLSPRAGIRCNACGTSLASLTAPCRCKNVHGERDRFAPAPAPAAPVEPKKPDFVSDVIASAAELAKSGADGKATVQRAVTDAGLAGRKPSTWTKEEAGRVNAGLPPPFRVVF